FGDRRPDVRQIGRLGNRTHRSDTKGFRKIRFGSDHQSGIRDAPPVSGDGGYDDGSRKTWAGKEENSASMGVASEAFADGGAEQLCACGRPVRARPYYFSSEGF